MFAIDRILREIPMHVLARHPVLHVSLVNHCILADTHNTHTYTHTHTHTHITVA